MMKTAIVLASVLLMSFAPVSAQTPGDIYLGDIEGLVNGSILIDNSGGTQLTFTINYRNNGQDNLRGNRNGFEIRGRDSSVTWQNLNRWLHPSIPVYCFDWPWFGPPPSNGVGADTIGFSATFGFCWWGLPAGLDTPVLQISVVLADTASVGGTFCLDSAWYPPDGSWMWFYGSSVGSSPPSWDGPHCWPIVGQCCTGLRGNVDGSADDLLSISDLVYLVDYMFTGGPLPPCWEEADINGSGGSVLDISDLVYILEYMFDGGFAPPACP